MDTNFGETLFNPWQSTFWPPKFLIFPHMKYIHPIPTISKVVTRSSINSKTKISCKYHQLKKPLIHHLNHIWGIFWVRSIQKQNSTPFVDQWPRIQIIFFLNIMVEWVQDKKSKKGQIRRNKRSQIPSRENTIKFQGLRIVLCGSLL